MEKSPYVEATSEPFGWPPKLRRVSVRRKVAGVQRFAIHPLDSSTLLTAKHLLLTYGNAHALRTLDALQLSACILAGASAALCFVCADVRLLPLCALTGLSFLNPELERSDGISGMAL